ncbi:MAG: type I glyceraldehyde-3-phosphate dehydrogenase [Methylotenera sp.]|nr:type I glyceraldehyde-3-phosphate dehydrogenase [Methylotenera sp.]MDP1958455.1 type I glyceraldehyde-3-phosphate dehydrogenase [Methylotenera sp.]MDP3206419.1 type I glyceraldehyde-3-phosphate dehydrogenase [Methylotenera sp.]MDP3304420.1 type I glyceraldehyde-3-phosphate dehydrogenase [Methylotenera sp.]MDP3942460.1 type I glyceraldehyde-3-phosphate dehydrogenase [Methylotenera sp.]
MAIRVAINGYGRIGRMVLRALYEQKRKDIEIIAINSMGGDAESNAHLTRYDSVHGRFPFDVGVDGDDMIIGSQKIKTFAVRNPAELPWRDLAIDVVLECTGAFNSKAKAQAHIDAGAKKVLLSAPGDKDIDATVVYGVNNEVIKASHTVISNASCTTNGLAPMVKPLHEQIGIVNGLMNTIHSYTNDQVLTDSHHSDMRRARSATQSLIPTKTGAAAAVGLVLPDLNGKLDGFAIRVPTINVSLVDLTFTAARPTSKEEVNHIMHEAANIGALKGVLSYNEAPLVSIDYNHTSFSSNFDATLTKVTKDGLLVKVCAWYDNEWGFSCRMLDNVVAMMEAK